MTDDRSDATGGQRAAAASANDRELPAPDDEIRVTTLHSTRGANYWSRRPVTRMDLVVGAYDEIPSSRIAGFTERLLHALPGLVEHRCSIGERGGFVVRLRRGTYAPHIIEHIALELQTMIGHEVGYGRTRGGDVPGEYSLVFEHRHEGVGLRAAWLALDVLKRAIDGTLTTVDAALAELRAIAETPAPETSAPNVRCAVTGSASRAATRDALAAATRGPADVVVDVAPGYILYAGLPYRRSEVAVILDASPSDVPERYQDRERARRLVSVVIDAVPRDGLVIVPAKEWELQDLAHEAGCRVAVFATDDDVTARDTERARVAAWVQGGRIVIEQDDECRDHGPLLADADPVVQVVGALGRHCLAMLAQDDPARDRGWATDLPGTAISDDDVPMKEPSAT